MDESALLEAAMLGVDLPLPDGTIIRCRPLKLSQTIYFSSLMEQAEKGDASALIKLFDEFPKAVGGDTEPAIVEAFENLLGMPGDFFRAFRSFFGMGATQSPMRLGVISPNPSLKPSPDSSESTS